MAKNSPTPTNWRGTSWSTRERNRTAAPSVVVVSTRREISKHITKSILVRLDYVLLTIYLHVQLHPGICLFYFNLHLHIKTYAFKKKNDIQSHHWFSRLQIKTYVVSWIGLFPAALCCTNACFPPTRNRSLSGARFPLEQALGSSDKVKNLCFSGQKSQSRFNTLCWWFVLDYNGSFQKW